jgi:hypothetical protein
MALLASLLALALAGCGGAGNGEEPRKRARPLPAGWYEDPDGDLVPTAAELLMGTDPRVDECARASNCPRAGAASALDRSNTLLILDSSGSMAGSASGATTKMQAAKRALRRYVAGTPDSLALGFMVYGHKGSDGSAGKARSCAGVELLEPIGTAAARRFARSLRRFRPTGYTPLAAALRKARGAFAGKDGDINRIILVTDGVETCDGDPVLEARRLKRAGIAVTTDVVGFDVADPDEARRLRAIAEASGGSYTDARASAALEDFFVAEHNHVSDLAVSRHCVVDAVDELNLCQTDAGETGSLHMYQAEEDAQLAGRRAQAREIGRLHDALDAAAARRRENLQRRSDATARRLDRELEAAERRLERLGP